ncbi:MAG: L,D-transpeptidase family protein, partial [Beijerinckiaceae bacterium]
MNFSSFARLAPVAIAALWLAAPAVAQSLLSPAPMGGAVQPAPTTPAPPVLAPSLPDAPAASAPPVLAPAPKPKPAARPTPVRETVVNASDPRPSFSPATFEQTGKAYERYLRIVETGGWPTVPAALSPGAKSPAVRQLQIRLAISGDMNGPETGVYDAATVEAVKHFQVRHGLKATGIVAGATLTAMNVSAQTRFRQLAASARRLALSQFPFGERYVVVNIPAAVAETIENGRVVRRYTAVVGKKERASPEVETRITTVNFNPTWTVPPTVLKKDIIPKMQKDPGYLARARIKLLDGGGNAVDPRSVNWSSGAIPNYTLRQDSGAGNALGQVRVDMPNSHAVYMHDTPSKSLFARDDRFHSSGCVRVEGVRDFVTWLLQPQGWTRDRVDAAMDDEERRNIRLNQAVPVAWIYLTGYATADGVVHFRDDVYAIDKGPGRTAQN